MTPANASLMRLCYMAAGIAALCAYAIESCREPPLPQSVAVSTSGGERPDVEALLYRIETLELRADGAEDSLKTLWWLEEQTRTCTPTHTHQSER